MTATPQRRAEKLFADGRTDIEVSCALLVSLAAVRTLRTEWERARSEAARRAVPDEQGGGAAMSERLDLPAPSPKWPEAAETILKEGWNRGDSTQAIADALTRSGFPASRDGVTSKAARCGAKLGLVARRDGPQPGQRHLQTWTEVEDAHLIEACREGASASAIARELTEAGFEVTKNAVLGRIFRLREAARMDVPPHLAQARSERPALKARLLPLRALGEKPPREGCRWICGRDKNGNKDRSVLGDADGVSTLWCDEEPAWPGGPWCALHLPRVSAKPGPHETVPGDKRQNRPNWNAPAAKALARIRA